MSTDLDAECFAAFEVWHAAGRVRYRSTSGGCLRIALRSVGGDRVEAERLEIRRCDLRVVIASDSGAAAVDFELAGLLVESVEAASLAASGTPKAWSASPVPMAVRGIFSGVAVMKAKSLAIPLAVALIALGVAVWLALDREDDAVPF